MKHYLAFDLGASSGRAILGTIDHGNVTLKELHRFENGPIAINGGLFWNLLGLFAELKAGLKAALREGVEISSIAIDTWGVDYAFIDEQGFFAGFPRNYRDPRTEDVMPKLFDTIDKQTIYALTGIGMAKLREPEEPTAAKAQ